MPLAIVFTKYDLLVLFCVLIISLSGLIVNYIKNPSNDNIHAELDNSSLIIFRIFIPLSLFISLFVFLMKWDIFQFNSLIIVVIGFVLFLIGLIIRWIAIISLGYAFTVKVIILKDQNLNTNGIYKYIRHPSYTGLLLYYLGLGLLMSNYLSIFILVFSSIIIVMNRIKTEEKVLVDHFKSDYINYQKKTYKIIPFVY